mmetsp:Transcript_17594/g.29790  ORF Transcript_17594/g.29790 Transcript_17594/m.29790 type:complete len:80 (+) Transcript_17594:127-366(+)
MPSLRSATFDNQSFHYHRRIFGIVSSIIFLTTLTAPSPIGSLASNPPPLYIIRRWWNEIRRNNSIIITHFNYSSSTTAE